MTTSVTRWAPSPPALTPALLGLMDDLRRQLGVRYAADAE